jgi:hypothetical protein
MTFEEINAILNTAKTQDEWYALARKLDVCDALLRIGDVVEVHDPNDTETREEKRARWLALMRAHRTPSQMKGA